MSFLWGEKVPWGGLFSARRLPHCELPTCEGQSALTPEPCPALREVEDSGGPTGPGAQEVAKGGGKGGSSSEPFPSVQVRNRVETVGLCYAFQKDLETWPGAGHPGSRSDLPSRTLLLSSGQGPQHGLNVRRWPGHSLEGGSWYGQCTDGDAPDKKGAPRPGRNGPGGGGNTRDGDKVTWGQRQSHGQ